MESERRTLASAGLACLLALAAVVHPAAASLDPAEDGAPAATARTIPVAPVDPGSTAGRIVLGFAEWLEQRVGSGSDGVRLALDAPMWAEERGDAVMVHLPGAHLYTAADAGPQWTLGDLTIAITPRDDVTYDFETALPPAIDKGQDKFVIDQGTVSGTWRSDLEITTRLEANAANIRFVESKGPRAVETASLGALSVADELVEGDDGLWDGRSTLELSDLEAEGFSLGRLDVAGSFEDFDRNLILQMRGDFDSFAGGASSPTALGDLLMPLVEGRWGRSEMAITLHDLTATGDDADLGGGELSLGRLEWRGGADSRRAFADLFTRISAADVVLGGDAAEEIPPALIPRAATVDIALSRLPLRRIADSLAGLAKRGEMGRPGNESMMEVVLDHLDAADSSLEIREIHVVTPSCEVFAEGRFQIEPASLFGVIGRVDARVRGFDSLMELAVEEGKEEAVAFLIVLQGLGRPVFEEGTNEPSYAFEIDLRRDGAVTVNGIPFDMLLQSGLSPQ